MQPIYFYNALINSRIIVSYALILKKKAMKQAMIMVRFLFSTRLTSILFIVFCVAMAVGTFVESFHNTATARIWVYNAWWFEAIMGVL